MGAIMEYFVDEYETLNSRELSEEEMSSILSALVAHGLILPRLKGAEVEYIVTEFGKYFFDNR